MKDSQFHLFETIRKCRQENLEWVYNKILGERKFIEPYHTNQNPFKWDMGKWRYDMNKVVMDNNVDYRGWFLVAMHTDDVSNHQANQGNDHNLLPLTVAKGEIWDIIFLTEFYFNEDILYQNMIISSLDRWKVRSRRVSSQPTLQIHMKCQEERRRWIQSERRKEAQVGEGNVRSNWTWGLPRGAQ